MCFLYNRCTPQRRTTTVVVVERGRERRLDAAHTEKKEVVIYLAAFSLPFKKLFFSFFIQKKSEENLHLMAISNN